MWPIELIRQHLDRSVPPFDGVAFEQALTAGGLGPNLAGFLAPLYGVANDGSFLGGALRILPFGAGETDVLRLNAPDVWKVYAPEAGRAVFYFMHNAFGDLFGVPLDSAGELMRDSAILLWLEQYKVDETPLTWGDALAKVLRDEQDVGSYLGRLREYEWACSHLGKPGEGECFSMKVPIALGGAPTLENMHTTVLSAHLFHSSGGAASLAG